MTENDQITIPKADFEKIIDVIHSIKIPDSEILDRLFSIKEAAAYLRCSVVSFYKIRKEKDLEHTLVGKKIFFKKSILDSYLGLNKSILFTRKQLYERFNINRLQLLNWEIDGRVTGMLVNQEVKYRISEVVAAIRQDKKEKEAVS